MTKSKRKSSERGRSDSDPLTLGIAELREAWQTTDMMETAAKRIAGVQRREYIREIKDERDVERDRESSFWSGDEDDIKKHIGEYLEENQSKLKKREDLVDLIFSYIKINFPEIDAIRFLRKDLSMSISKGDERTVDRVRYTRPYELAHALYNTEINMELLTHEYLRKNNPKLLRALKNQKYREEASADLSDILTGKIRHIMNRMKNICMIFGLDISSIFIDHKIKTIISIARSIDNHEALANIVDEKDPSKFANEVAKKQ